MSDKTRYWVPQGTAMDDARSIMGSHQRWMRDVHALANAVGGKCAAIGRSFCGFYLAGIAFDSPPDQSQWKQVKCCDGIAYAPKRTAVKKTSESGVIRILDVMDHIPSNPQELLRKRFAPKEDAFLCRMGAEVVGETVVLIESFDWTLRDCKRISDMEYESMVESAKKPKRRSGKTASNPRNRNRRK